LQTIPWHKVDFKVHISLPSNCIFKTCLQQLECSYWNVK
jgi:hypothetical protein